MSCLSRRDRRGKHDARKNFPLFDWAEAHDRAAFPDYPTRWVHRRFGVPTDRASLIARLAGLGGEL
jgi:hypothetical protein